MLLLFRKCREKVKSLGLLGTYSGEIRQVDVSFEEQMVENRKHRKEILKMSHSRVLTIMNSRTWGEIQQDCS